MKHACLCDEVLVGNISPFVSLYEISTPFVLTPLFSRILTPVSCLDVRNGGWGAHRAGSGPALAVSRSAGGPYGLSAGTGQSRSDESSRRISARAPPVKAADRPLSFRCFEGFRIWGHWCRSEHILFMSNFVLVQVCFL